MSKTIAALAAVLLLSAAPWPATADGTTVTRVPAQAAECADYLLYLEFGTPTDDAARPACEYGLEGPGPATAKSAAAPSESGDRPVASHKAPVAAAGEQPGRGRP
jgi:hypothetical protein